VKEYMSITRSFRGERINILIKKEKREKKTKEGSTRLAVCVCL